MSTVYTDRYNSMVINEDAHKLAVEVCARILKYKSRYLEVQRLTGVPWQLVAALHYRESDLNFNTYLGNGDPLNRVTVHVPRGRGPFVTWVNGAVDALKLEGFDKQTVWKIESCLYLAEDFNGFGYRDHHGMNIEDPDCDNLSPYVWAGTNWYMEGMYVKDGKFSESAIDHRIGIAVIIYYLTKNLTQTQELTTWSKLKETLNNWWNKIVSMLSFTR